MTHTLRPHPLYLWYRIRRWALLLLIPLLRMLLFSDTGEDLLWLPLRDTVLLMLPLGYALWCRRHTGYRLTASPVIRSGRVFQRHVRIAAHNLVSVEWETTPLLRLFHGRRLRIHTADTTRKKQDTWYLPVSARAHLTGELFVGDAPSQTAYRASAAAVFALALSGSNAASGVLALVPAVRWSGRLTGSLSLEGLNFLKAFPTLPELPPLLNLAANLLWLGWSAAVLAAVLRYFAFTVERGGDVLRIRSGFLTRREQGIRAAHVTAVGQRRTLLMALLDLCAVSVTTAGYGWRQGEQPVILPAVRRATADRLLPDLLPELISRPQTAPADTAWFHPRPSAAFRYLLFPTLTVVGMSWWLAVGGVWRAAALAGLFFGIWWMLIRLMGFFRAGAGIQNGMLLLRFPRRLSLWEVRIRPCAVTDLHLTRSPLRRWLSGCTLHVTCAGSTGSGHAAGFRVWSLPYRELRDHLKLN